MNYYKRHLGDFAKDTAHLSAAEVGTYDLLLDRYYGTERPIRDDEANKIARAKTAQDRAIVRSVLGEFFKRRGEHWHHNYADGVIEAAHKKAGTNRENGKLGGRPPQFGPHGTKANGPQDVTQTEPKTNPEETQTVISGLSEKTLATNPLAISQEKKTALPAARAGFDQFKAVYPRREAWGRAQKAWNALKPDAETVAKIIAAIAWQKASGCLQDKSADGRSLRPLPATYLNDRRWLDEPPSARAAQPAAETPRCREPSCDGEGLYGGYCQVHYMANKPRTAAQIAAGIA